MLTPSPSWRRRANHSLSRSQYGSECLADCFAAPVSTGWLASLLPSAAEKLDGFLAVARERLRAAEVAHFDETGGRVGATLRWIHVAGDRLLDALPHRRTARQHRDGRGRGAARLHRRRRARRTPALPQLPGRACDVQRPSPPRTGWPRRVDRQDWPTRLADLLVEILPAVQATKAAGATALPARRLAAFRRRYDVLVADGQRLNPPPPRTGKRGRPRLGPAAALLARLELHRDDVLRFAVDFRVPFDNNQAERDVRMVKLQQKISGGWRSQLGATAFLAVRSYLSTARKHRQTALT